MKAMFFHFMNALRVPIMFVTKLLLWLFIPMTLLLFSEYLGWTEWEIWGEEYNLLSGAFISSFTWAGIYYFRWKYDVVLVLLKPKDAEIMAVSKDDTHIAGKN